MKKKRENWNIEVNKKIINHSCAAHETNACNHATNIANHAENAQNEIFMYTSNIVKRR
jgi:hypothetical protein